MRSAKIVSTIETGVNWLFLVRWAMMMVGMVGLLATAAGSDAFSGRVLDQAGGGLPGASVILHKLSGEAFDTTLKTDAKGAFSVDSVPDGEYAIRAELRGFASLTIEPVNIYFPTQVRRDFVLRVVYLGSEGGVYTSSNLVGELIWHDLRVPNASICLITVDQEKRAACTTTNRLGQYSLSVQPGLYTVTVNNGADLKVKRELDMKVPGEYRNKIRLEPPPQ